MTERPPPDLPPDAASIFDVSDPVVLAEALAFLESLSKGLFPSGQPVREQVTWPDRDGSAALTDDGKVRTTEERLRAAEARFSTLVEQIPAVTFMAVLGEGENEMYVSPHIEQLLGYDQKQWLSDPFLWYNRLHPDDRALWNQEFARGCHSGGPFRAECRFLARDGRVVWVHGEARVVKDQSGRPQFLQGVAFDITESKRAQELLLDNAVRQAKIDEEVEIARRVQQALVPAKPELPGLDMSVSMLPAEDVGGDYYDVQPTSFGGWIAIGDVSGHGLNAGLVMLMLESAMLTVQGALPESMPAQALTVVNRVLCENIKARMQRREYITLSLLRYERSGRVVFAGAHQDIVICRADGTLERVATPGPWLGIIDDLPHAVDSEIWLREGDLMVLFTDGVIEARDRAGDLFEMDRLCEAIHALRNESTADIRDGVLARVRSFMHTQDDDLTLIVVRYHAG
jgi:PAS domain S-box-containing protein